MVLGFGLGALGGTDFYNPSRKRLPNSGPIQSDHEWNDEWEAKINAIPEYIKVMKDPSEWVQLSQNHPDFDASKAKPYLDRINSVNKNYFLSNINAGPSSTEMWGGLFDSALEQGYLLMPNGKGGFTQAVSGFGPLSEGQDQSVLRQATYTDARNPERDHIRNQQNEAWQLRQENQLRQQQAYDWMQGAGQENAVMSPDYANAGFNQITGLSNPYAGPSETEGVGMDWAAGVYDPTTQQGTGTYNPTHKRTNFGW